MNFESFLKTFDKIEPLSNLQIIDQCKQFKIKHFKGVFMRNELNKTASNNECLILNLDHSTNTGTHWTCVFIKAGVAYYFDSFGFEPPIEVKEYLHKFDRRYYNSFEIQKVNQVICGHFCIYVLVKLNRGNGFYDILDELYKYNYKIFHHFGLSTQ
jgi:hypothetical protein